MPKAHSQLWQAPLLNQVLKLLTKTRFVRAVTMKMKTNLFFLSIKHPMATELMHARLPVSLAMARVQNIWGAHQQTEFVRLLMSFLAPKALPLLTNQAMQKIRMWPVCPVTKKTQHAHTGKAELTRLATWRVPHAT